MRWSGKKKRCRQRNAYNLWHTDRHTDAHSHTRTQDIHEDNKRIICEELKAIHDQYNIDSMLYVNAIQMAMHMHKR